MSFSVMSGYPTSPPRKARKPVDLGQLPPEMQQRLAAGETVRFEDGSAIYPDGTSEGAGDSPDDYTMPPALDMGPGGFNSAPSFAGPAPSFAGSAPPADAAPNPGYLADPMFDRYNRTVAGGGPPTAPDAGPFPDPFAPPATSPAPGPGVQLTVEGPRVGDYGVGPNEGANQRNGQRPMTGRMRRRMGGGTAGTSQPVRARRGR